MPIWMEKMSGNIVRRREVLIPIDMGSTTWQGMSGNGVLIGMEKVTILVHP